MFSDPLTVRFAGPHQESLLGALVDHAHVEVSVSPDAVCDLSFLQLLEAARVYAGTAGRVVSLSRAAEGGLLDLLERSGFLSAMTPEDRRFWLHEGVTP
ncbi:STAS domain-containing protein [Affinirhizobium pseudoryzae]|uniref:STAS domain-containing protein n=1 Tax=Allorhizobium pseudoryzae TaxID=379684 RepID=UPI0013ED855F|nr:STAS domain-containing protein [Allorhizobium pseudoryzae]